MNTPTNGDTGEEKRHVTMEPVETPLEVPQPETIPA